MWLHHKLSRCLEKCFKNTVHCLYTTVLKSPHFNSIWTAKKGADLNSSKSTLIIYSLLLDNNTQINIMTCIFWNTFHVSIFCNWIFLLLAIECKVSNASWMIDRPWTYCTSKCSSCWGPLNEVMQQTFSQIIIKNLCINAVAAVAQSSSTDFESFCNTHPPTMQNKFSYAKKCVKLFCTVMIT